MTTQKATQMTAESVTGHGIVDLDARVVRATVGLVSQVGPADLARPTPCAGWTLGDLIGHMTAQHDGWTGGAARGRPGAGVRGGGRAGAEGVRRRRRARPGVRAGRAQPGAAVPRGPGDRLPLHRLPGAWLGRGPLARPGLRAGGR